MQNLRDLESRYSTRTLTSPYPPFFTISNEISNQEAQARIIKALLSGANLSDFPSLIEKVMSLGETNCEGGTPELICNMLNASSKWEDFDVLETLADQLQELNGEHQQIILVATYIAVNNILSGKLDRTKALLALQTIRVVQSWTEPECVVQGLCWDSLEEYPQCFRQEPLVASLLQLIGIMRQGGIQRTADLLVGNSVEGYSSCTVNQIRFFCDKHHFVVVPGLFVESDDLRVAKTWAGRVDSGSLDGWASVRIDVLDFMDIVNVSDTAL